MWPAVGMGFPSPVGNSATLGQTRPLQCWGQQHRGDRDDCATQGWVLWAQMVAKAILITARQHTHLHWG